MDTHDCTIVYINNVAVWQITIPYNYGLLKAVNDYAIPIEEYLGYQYAHVMNTSVLNTYPISLGWNVVQIQLAYSPVNYKERDCIQIGTLCHNITDYSFNADFDDHLTGLTLSSAFNNFNYTASLVPMFQNQANLLGREASLYIENIAPRSNINLPMSPLSTSALVSSGFTKLFNNFLGKSNNDQAVVNQELEIKTLSKGDLRGSSKSTMSTSISPITFSIRPEFIGTEVGVWNLTKSPTIYIHPIGAYKPSKKSKDKYCYTFQASGNFLADVVLNPNLGDHVIDYWVTVDPVRYFHSSDRNVNPIPSFDYGSLGGNEADSNPNCGTNSKITPKDCFYLYEGEPGALYDDYYQADCQFKGLDSKYGTKKDGKPYSFVYGPDNVDLITGNMRYRGDDHLVRVNLHLVTEFEGKRDTTVSTRTYFPKI